jgi:cell division protein FtsW
MLAALIGLGFTSIVPYHFWQKHARTLFLINMALLLTLYIPGLGNEYGTARSWLHVGFFSLQPSEFLKLTLIFYMAVWLQKKESSIATFKEGFVPFVILLCLSTFFVAIQPDLGSFLVFSVMCTTMFFVAGGNIVHLLLGAATAGFLGLPIILNKEYIRNRFTVFLHILFHPDDLTYREGIGFQVYQALIAIGSGGLFGVGYGKSIQKFGYLPEVQSDTIFAAMAEELGFLRLLIVLSLYGIFVYRGLRIARNAPDRFGLLVATGITTGIAFQTLLNICVNLSLFPITGLTLPFISYGGSSLLTTLCGVGILLNISMHSTGEDATIRRTARAAHVSTLRRFIPM